MPGTSLIAPSRRDVVLEESIQQRRSTVLTHRTPAGWRTYKSTFASGSRDAGLITLSVRIPEGTTSADLPASGAKLGVSFRLGHKKCMFSGAVTRVQHRPQATLLTLPWPTQVQQLQRRAYERAAPPAGTVVAVRFRIDEPSTDEEGGQRRFRHGQLEDVSAGGMRIKVADPKEMEIDHTYRCIFSARGGAPPVVLDATLRHREAGKDARASLGFQFIGLETSPEGRRALDQLARIVHHYQTAARRTGR